MEEELVTVQISAEYRDKLRILAQMDKRSMKGEFEWMVEQELVERLSQPHQIVRIDATPAGNNKNPGDE